MPIWYHNSTYRFRLTIPKWWRKHVFVEETACGLKDARACIRFKLRYRKSINGVVSTPIFDLIVFNMSKRNWDARYKDSPLQFIASSKKVVYAALTPGEPPDEFLLPDQTDYNRRLREFKYLSRMINRDLPEILKSFQLCK
ncbi:hypothetical protein [Ammoniphilus sp. YIM 78166]|uniref:hypothetical protein n=1 Tax=Ammoniphilus sp. YIM 78166 TaxID=1644106 RepID=UPI00106FC4FB|nr:hypothetical protein [Ammoniphilus sp. YIM 78166]